MKRYNFIVFQSSWIMISLFFLLLIPACQQPADETRAYGWFDFSIPDLDSSRNVVDLSFLNSEEAGKSGFITEKDGHFVDGHGQKIRFFGDNLTFSSCFLNKDTAVLFAARLKKLGMNVIRFHHMDNQPSPGGIWNKSMTELDSLQLDKLDWLVYQLKLHGVYSNLNTHVSRTYPGVDEKIEQFHFGKTIDQFYRPYIEMQKDYAKKLLTHRNPYTGTTYDNEPAVAFVEVNNENSLLSSWKLLPQLNKEHKADLVRQWKAWLSSKTKYPKNADLMAIILNYDKQKDQQKEMLWGFLMDTELSYAKEMIEYYKNDLKIHALVCESQASYSGVQGMNRESRYSDFIDMHSYWEHPDFPGQSWSSTDWLIRNSSMVTDKKGGTLLSFGEHRVAGMPLTISEYDHPAPSFFCAEMYPMLNSVAAFQDFDGIYHFDTNDPFGSGQILNFFSTSGHPLKQVFIPVGTVLFRMGAVQPGKHAVQLDLPSESILEKLVEFGGNLRLHGSNMQSIWEEAGSSNAMILLHPMNVNMQGKELKLSDKVQDPAGPWESDTGELTWDSRDSIQSVFKINAPSAKAAVGYIGGKSIDLGDVTIAMDTTPYNWATITITSLDGKPLDESSKILLVAAGRVENTNMQWNKDKTSVGDQWGTSPTRAEGIPAKLVFRNMKKFSVQALDPAGNPGTEIGVNKNGEEQSFGIGAQYKTLWYILTRD